MRIQLNIDFSELLTNQLLKREVGVVPAVRTAVRRLVSTKMKNFYTETNMYAGQVAETLEHSNLLNHGALDNCLIALTLRTPGGWNSAELQMTIRQARLNGDSQSHLGVNLRP